MKKRVLFSLLLVIQGIGGMAQQTHDWETYYQELTDEDEMENDSYEETYDLLSQLEAQPTNINTASREDLERLPFLTQQQIEDICAYIYQYGGMQTLSELFMIESLDPIRCRLLACFFYASIEEKKKFPTLKTITQYGKHELTATAKIPFYKRKGDQEGYLGYPYRHSLRYSFHYADYVKASLIGAQDSGEPFFANKNKWGYDHYSFYLQLRKLGRLRSAVAGRYKIRSGMGLILNTDFGYGKTSTLMTLGRNSNLIRPASSRSSANYLQGVAATVDIGKNMELTAFISSRTTDATLTKDGKGIATLLKTGYHRTVKEMEKKNNVTMSVGGGKISFRKGGFQVGATALYTWFDKPLQPNTSQPYRKYQASGQHFWNASIDYNYTSHRLNIAGETATGNSHALATLNTISYKVASNLDIMALQRFYSYQYVALLGQSFNDGGYVQNESGVYIGAQWKPSRSFTVMGYVDIAYFPWMKYQVNSSSHGFDQLLSVIYQHQDVTAGLRYRFKRREKNNTDKTALIGDATHRLRLYYSYQKDHWGMKTQADMAYNDYKEHSFGWMLSQTANYSHRTWLLVATLGYFHTKDYSSRLYTYERGMLYSLSFPAYYGHGIRAALLARATLSHHWMVMGKLSTTHYFDRDKISSGLQTIEGKSQTDLELQVRYRF